MLEEEYLEKEKETERAAQNQLAGKHRGCVTKEITEKMKKYEKKNTIKIGKSEEVEEEMTRIK